MSQVTKPTSPNNPQSSGNVVLKPHATYGSSNQRISIGPEGHFRQAQVLVRKQNDVIQAIDVVCSCGEKITIELQY